MQSLREFLTTPARQAEGLRETAHRPWPPPDRRWIQGQTWEQLLFAHWRVPEEALRAIVPPQLSVDTFDDSGWLGITPFRVTGLRLRGTFPIPYLSTFLELNVRTYVRHGEHTGVWFFSLDASNPLAVRAARTAVHLPYYDARMRMDVVADGSVHYRSDRTHRGAPPASFDAAYRPEGDVRPAAPGTLEYFLVERYKLFSATPVGLVQVTIAHRPWPLQRAVVRIDRNTMGEAAGVALKGEPALVHFGGRVDVRTWWPASV